MSITYMCDVCQLVTIKSRLLRLVVYNKGAATRQHKVSLDSKDICMKCWQKCFGDKK